MRPALPLLFGLVLGLAACGGGSAGGPSFAGGGTSGTGITRGPVSGFSSVIVSGQRYRIGPDTEILLNGEPTELDAKVALDVGLPVTVYWEERDASANLGDDDAIAGDPSDESDPLAEEIVYDPTLIGPVTGTSGFADGLDPSDKLEVLGVRVHVTTATLVTDSDGVSRDIADFVAGDAVVEVAGEPLSDGSVLAVSIREIGSVNGDYFGPYEVEGYVTATEVPGSGTAFSLKVDGLVVEYAGARGARRFESGELIVATADDISSLGNTDPKAFFPDEISLKERGFEVPSGKDRDVTLDGYVSRVINLAQFIVAGQIVVLPPAQVGPPPDVDVGDLVRVEGTYSGESGRVIADDFDLVGPSEILIEDRLAFEISDSDTLTTQLGIELLITGNTVFWDEHEDRLQPSDLRGLDALRIVAAQLGEDLYAVRVERNDHDGSRSSCNITARVDEYSIVNRNLTIFDGLEVRWANSNDLFATADRPLRDGALVRIEAEDPGCNESLVPESRFGSIDAERVTVLAEETFGEGEEDNGGDKGDGENDGDDGRDDEEED